MNKLVAVTVGCGHAAQHRHIPTFLRQGGSVHVSAVCDLNFALAKDTAGKFGIAKCYSSLAEMLSKEEPDIVDICVPPEVHEKTAIEAMEGGSHVLIEKPMALSVEGCEEMIRVARANSVKLCVVHNQRFYPPFLRAIELVQKGVIGEVLGVRICFLSREEEYMNKEHHWVHKLPGGVLGETGPHTVYMSLPFARTIRDAEVTASKTLAYPWVNFDTFSANLIGDSLIQIFISHASKYTAEEVEILGTQGKIWMDLQSMLLNVQTRRYATPLSLAASSLGASTRIVQGVVSNAISSIMGRSLLGHDPLVRGFVESIRQDTVPPVPPEEGLETTRVMDLMITKLPSR